MRATSLVHPRLRTIILGAVLLALYSTVWAVQYHADVPKIRNSSRPCDGHSVGLATHTRCINDLRYVAFCDNALRNVRYQLDITNSAQCESTRADL